MADNETFRGFILLVVEERTRGFNISDWIYGAKDIRWLRGETDGEDVSFRIFLDPSIKRKDFREGFVRHFLGSLFVF